MRLNKLKKISIPQTVEAVTQFLEGYLQAYLQDLYLVLLNLDFENNFGAFVVEVEIAAGQEISIPHTLRVVPKSRIILKSNTPLISDGSDPWTTARVSLKNTDSIAATVKVAFLRV